MSKIPDFDDLPEVKGMPKGTHVERLVVVFSFVADRFKAAPGVCSTKMARKTSSAA